MSPGATRDALGYCVRIRDLILHHSGGWADGAALWKLRLLSHAAQRAAADAECAELLRATEAYAADLFSKDAHRRWAHGRTSGSDVLRLNILSKLDAVRERLIALNPGARSPDADPMLYPPEP